ncbi:phosphoribosylaminoimidazole carboxylase [Rhizophagus clarus]|uniref:Phosphoribosylaminoimidazole carboxylase n=1 Tax=Rhizophagus clarus TaxID=94130 RepID=A0A8H3LIZ4_9GLOM|nr:phosphoribosylaminoimidazole carboxylase [Rhizophagus clarus]
MNSKKLGVLGGGQLGRMLVEAASRLNISVTILDNPVDSPAKQIQSTSTHIHGDFKDPLKIQELAQNVDVLTIEIEHVEVEILEKLFSEKSVEIHPHPFTIRIIQDKFLQKTHLSQNEIPVVDFMNITDRESLNIAVEKFGYPIMLKSKILAYDGRGNYVINSDDEITNALKTLGNFKIPLYVERWTPFVKELAVMLLLRLRLMGAGIFGVEMFLMKNGHVYVNEIAPRPHNSGHYTIEACETSQYENHIRSILNMPLGSTSLKVPAAAMINVLGKSENIQETLGPCVEALTTPGATIHLYGKKECRKGRKMGHITIVADSISQLYKRINPILNIDDENSISTTSSKNIQPLVGIIMGSDSDLPTMKACAEVLKSFDVPFELSIVSAHRTPMRMVEYAKTAHVRGLKVIIAGAGGAAHLPGMVAALTPLPVIGVPVKGKILDGVDSLYSIVQMPRGVPVATVAINNSTNAGLLAVRHLGAFIPSYLQKVQEFTERQEKIPWNKTSQCHHSYIYLK